MKKVHPPEDMPAHLQKEDVSDKTIPVLFKERVEQRGEEVAFRNKHMGIFKEISWQEYWREAEEFGFGLLELGLSRGDRVAIMGEPCAEWLYADMAVLCAGGISFGIYSTSSPEETYYAVEKVESKFFVAENQEYVDKILPFLDRVPFLHKIIVIDTRATFTYDDPRLIGFDQVQAFGRKRKLKSPDEFSRLIREIRPDDPAFLVFTSGTTGPPKPATITHRNILISFVYAFSEVFEKFWTHEQRSVSHLSLAHIFERCTSIYFALIYDWKPHIGEGVEYLQETLYEVQPTFFHGVPRIWEKMAGQIVVGIESSSQLKKWCYHWAMKIGWDYMEMKWKGRKVSLIWTLLRWFAHQICFRHILHQVGLSKAESALSTGAPLPPQIQKIWQVWGVDLINLLGSTEVAGVISSQRPGFPRPGDLGRPTTINEIRLAEDGEMLVSGPGVFSGYWNDREMTRQSIRDGWLYTGEIFEYTEEGNIKMIDRKKDIMVTSGGKNLAPSYIENAIKASPYISEVVVFADGRKFPAALIEIDFNTVADWARRNKVVYTGFTSLASHNGVYELIGEEVRKGNQALARVEQIKKFRIIPKELDPEAGDTTPTRKIKRDLMYRMFKDLVEEMFLSKETEALGEQMRT
jgi:long-chain acyl-CoA synthetase